MEHSERNYSYAASFLRIRVLPRATVQAGTHVCRPNSASPGTVLRRENEHRRVSGDRMTKEERSHVDRDKEEEDAMNSPDPEVAVSAAQEGSFSRSSADAACLALSAEECHTHPAAFSTGAVCMSYRALSTATACQTPRAKSF